MSRVNVEELMGETPCYADYEMLAFMDSEQEWVTKTKRCALRFGMNYRREAAEVENFAELVFYHSVHVLNSFMEVQDEITDDNVNDVTEAVAFTIDSLLTTKQFTRSGINWSEVK